MIRVQRMLPFVSGLLLVFALTACNFNKQKVDTQNDVVGPVTTADLNYANVNKKVISPYCLSCHSNAGGNRAGINLETYASLINQIELVQATAILEKSMPPTGSDQMSSSAYALLKAWIEAGAPQ